MSSQMKSALGFQFNSACTNECMLLKAWKLKLIKMAVHLGSLLWQEIWLCPRVPVHQGITIVFSLFRSLWLAETYCLVFCIGSCVLVHEDRTRNLIAVQWCSSVILCRSSSGIVVCLAFDNNSYKLANLYKNIE